MLAAGVRVGLGTDGAASNNRLDMLREMRHAALLAKAASGDATAVPAHQALRMATLDGAAALGLDGCDRLAGAREMGRPVRRPSRRLAESSPAIDPASHLVYVAGREQVSHVWVAGKLRICDGKPVGISIQRIALSMSPIRGIIDDCEH